MIDKLSQEKRSWNMSRVRSKDTQPELQVRKLLHQNGYRFRLHKKELPGKPDIVLPKFKTVIFVHGCFWHRHEGCPEATMPKTRTDFWTKKFSENVQRDKRTQNALQNAGWKVVVIWECELSQPDKVMVRIKNTLHGIKGSNPEQSPRDNQ